MFGLYLLPLRSVKGTLRELKYSAIPVRFMQAYIISICNLSVSNIDCFNVYGISHINKDLLTYLLITHILCCTASTQTVFRL